MHLKWCFCIQNGDFNANIKAVTACVAFVGVTAFITGAIHIKSIIFSTKTARKQYKNSTKQHTNSTKQHKNSTKQYLISIQTVQNSTKQHTNSTKQYKQHKNSIKTVQKQHKNSTKQYKTVHASTCQEKNPDLLSGISILIEKY